MFTRKIIALASGAVLIGGATFGAVTASAADPESGAACAVTGTATVHGETNNVPRTPGATSGFFNSTTISCAPPAQASDDGGNWTVNAVFNSDSAGEDCAAGNGSGHFNGGTAPNGAAGDGTVSTSTAANNSFTYTRAGSVVHVTGSIATTDASGGTESHAFHAVLNFTPTSGPCIGGAAGSDTVADLDGTAVITTDS